MTGAYCRHSSTLIAFRNFRNPAIVGRVPAVRRKAVRSLSSASAEVVSPVPADANGLADVLSFIEAHESRHGTSPEPAFFLSGAGEHGRVELTEQLYDVLKRAAYALSHGQSITILTRDQEISTQQAAEILGLSRPTVVRLIEDGELDAHVPGTIRRKLRLADVLVYREELHTRRNRFITESSEQFADADADAVAQLLAEAKRQR